jgi:transcriptional regulator with XRE-family HTH domain
MLRVWRQHAGLTQQELADSLAATVLPDGTKIEVRGKSTVANWESGTRTPSPLVVRKLAEALCSDPEEQEALVGLWQAAGSIAVLPPLLCWEHNYHAEGGRPAWLWLRCRPGGGSVTASVRWGPFGEDFRVPATDGGLLAHAPASLPNPPLQVTFSESSWADFGNGVVPEGVIDRLGMHAVAGMVVARGRFGGPLEITAAELREFEAKVALSKMQTVSSRFKVLWNERLKPYMGTMRPNSTVQPLEGARIVETSWTGGLRTDRGELVSQLLQPLERIKAIRRTARGLSARAAAEKANAPEADNAPRDILPADYITDNQVEAMERNGHVPHHRWTIARLDRAYGMDGHLGIDRIDTSSLARLDSYGRHEVHFPGFWVGPVWLQLRAPAVEEQEAMEGELDLYWGYWRLLQQVRHGTVVTTRKAVPNREPLRVRMPMGWTFVAGTGLVPGAIDINHDWYPISFKAAAKLAVEGFDMLKRRGHVW